MKISKPKNKLLASDSLIGVLKQQFFLLGRLLLRLIVQEGSLTLFINSIITKNHEKILTVIKNRGRTVGENNNKIEK